MFHDLNVLLHLIPLLPIQRKHSTYQSPGSVANKSFIDEMGQAWISNYICLIYQASSNNENPNKLKGKGRELHGITYSSAADSRRLLMEGEGKTKHKKREGAGGWDWAAQWESEGVREEERKRRESSVWCSDSRAHIWINASTKDSFLLFPSAGSEVRDVSLPDAERANCVSLRQQRSVLRGPLAGSGDAVVISGFHQNTLLAVVFASSLTRSLGN